MTPGTKVRSRAQRRKGATGVVVKVFTEYVQVRLDGHPNFGGLPVFLFAPSELEIIE